MNTKWNWLIILTMLFGMVFTGPKQTISAATSTTVEFFLISSANPSNYGQTVTFTLSATGSDPTYPPAGQVEFRDNGVTIPGCAIVNLNLVNGNPTADVPASCTTSSLTVGSHTITAVFTSLIPDVYADETITLYGGQTVNDSIQLTIQPPTLPNLSLMTYFQLLLIARYPGGGECENCAWWTEGNLPEGISLNAETGELRGTPTTLGTYSFNILVDDGNGARGSQAYSWNVTKVNTVVEVGTSTTYVSTTIPTALGATARHPDPNYSPRPTGKMSFSVDGIPVPGCSGTEALSTNMWGQAYCISYLPTGLASGSYQIRAEFTPDTTSSELYQSGSGTGTLQVNPQQAIVSGRVFLDDDQDGVKSETEVAQGVWHVYLNQDCDSFLEGNVDSISETGAFTFYPVPITDHTYCLYVDLYGFDGYVQTTPYNDLTLTGDQYFEIGIYYPHISILPGPEEPLRGSVGTYYEQSFQISGGTPPYTIEVSSNEYPLQDGLSFNTETLTLSGT
ncbi:MAG: Ig-like domain repeat protein, partial [Anaerolineaceae bacterium]|nr:Ig-like domain repeat protein [Anaerolineaceae bacterium]